MDETGRRGNGEEIRGTRKGTRTVAERLVHMVVLPNQPASIIECKSEGRPAADRETGRTPKCHLLCEPPGAMLDLFDVPNTSVAALLRETSPKMWPFERK
jgi:hypothetical protein